MIGGGGLGLFLEPTSLPLFLLVTSTSSKISTRSLLLGGTFDLVVVMESK